MPRLDWTDEHRRLAADAVSAHARTARGDGDYDVDWPPTGTLHTTGCPGSFDMTECALHWAEGFVPECADCTLAFRWDSSDAAFHWEVWVTAVGKRHADPIHFMTTELHPFAVEYADEPIKPVPEVPIKAFLGVRERD